MGNCVGQLPEQLLNSRQIVTQIQRLNPQQLFRYFDQYSQLKSLKSNQIFLNELQNRFKQVDKRYDEMRMESNVSLKKDKFDYKQQMSYLTNQIILLAKICNQQRQMIQKQQKKIKLSFQQKKQRLMKFQQDLKKIKQKNKIIKSEIVIQSQNQSMQKQKERLKQIQAFQQKIQQSFHADCIENTQQQIKGLVLTQVQNIKQKYQMQISQLERKIIQLSKQIQRNKKQSNQALTYLSEQKQQKILYLVKQKNKLQEINSIKTQELKKKDNCIQNLKKEIEQLQTTINTSKSLLKSNLSNNNTNITQKTDQKISQIKNKRSSSQIFTLFINSKIIFAEYHYGKKLRQIIQQIYKPINIIKTKLIFSYDKIKPNNMFQYINNQQNLLFLAKLKNGTIIGGFSKLGFKQNIQKMNNNLTFIFSIRQSLDYYKFELRTKSMAMHSVKLDKNYLRFGSNQLRINCGANKACSALNTSASMFQYKKQDKSCTIQDFLGQKQDKYELQNYQVFQLQIKIPQEVLDQSQQLILSEIHPSC